MSPERNQPRITFEELVSTAKENLLQDGLHIPILIIEGSKGLILSPLEEMPDTHAKRAAMMRMLGMALARSGKAGRLRQIFLVAEGWMSTARDGNPPRTTPSQDPERMEVLLVSALNDAGDKNLRVFEISRTETKQVSGLQEVMPKANKAGLVDVPLLEAFVEGFQRAFQARVN